MLRHLLIPVLTLGMATLLTAADDPPAALKVNADDKGVQQDLGTPDGATMRVLPDGDWQVFGQGTANYDFTDAGEVQDATKKAILLAKANIAKFLREEVTSSEKIDEMTLKSKDLASKNGKTTDAVVTKESVQVTSTSVSSHAGEIVSGVVVLESIKTPALGADGKPTNTGTVTVIVGTSKKSTCVAAQARADMNQPPPVAGAGGAGAGAQPAGQPAQPDNAGQPANNAEHLKSKSDL